MSEKYISKEELRSFIERALEYKNSINKIYLGKVSKDVSQKIYDLLGIDVQKRMHTLNDNDIRHILKRHGQVRENKQGQIMITINDLLKIIEIVSNPDEIIKGSTNDLGQAVKYIRKYDDGIIFVVEVIPANSGSLIIKTMWKKPSTLTDNNKVPSSYVQDER